MRCHSTAPLPPAVAALAVVLQLLALLTQLYHADALDATRMCGIPWVYRDPPWILPPSISRPTPALAAHSADAFSLYSCTLSFAQHEEAYRDWAACYHSVRMNVITCPRGCLQAVTLSPHNATVAGSYPYHANSSVCLAAIHAGVIDAAEGGGVLLGRFYPEDWSNGSSQSTYPHEAWRASLSHSVQSLEVPVAERPLPAPLLSYSWTVRTRGVVAAQR